MKKWIALILALVMAVSMFAGCAKQAEQPADDQQQSEQSAQQTTDAENGTEEQPADEQTTAQKITVAALQSAYGADMWTKVAEAFTAQTGIEVELIVDKNLEDVIGPSMKAGTYPDFVHLSAGREDALTEAFIKDRGLENVTDVLSMTVPGEDVTVGEKISAGFTDSTVTNPYNDGETYFAPMFYSPCGLFYNAGLLKEKGWEVPTTWDEMWELGDKAKEEGISLFCYPTAGYLQEFTFALAYSVGGPDFFNKMVNYEEGVWETEEGKTVLDIMAKLATYTEPSVPACANNQDFTKNQQLILDNKAIFMPNGTWVIAEMAEAPRADGFEWGVTAIPSTEAGGAGYSVAWIEQAWIPAAAENKDAAKQFMAFMYSDVAADIFAESNAIQPIAGLTDKISGDEAKCYAIYENGAKPALGSWAATNAVEGVSLMDTFFGAVNSLVSGSMTKDEWTASVISLFDTLRAAKQ